MSALSIRIEPELGQLLDLEVARRKTTKSKLVQEVLREALKPKDAIALLDELRNAHGLNELAKTAAVTNHASRVKELTHQVILQKYSQGGDVSVHHVAAEQAADFLSGKSK